MFGLTMLLTAGLGAWLARARGMPPGLGYALGALGLLFLLLALAAPAALRWPYRAWMGLGRALGRVTTPVLLFAVFVLVVLPLAFLLRLLRVDVLGLRFERRTPSYWIERRSELTREGLERLA